MGGKIRVLVVDDSAYMRVVLKDMLESNGNIIVIGTAKDGVEAVERAKSLAPDVILLDIQMPKIDGIATLKRIMKEAPTRVVMLSAMDKMDDQLPLRALEMGAVDFISKPSGPVSIDIVNFTDRISQVVVEAASTRVDALRRTMTPVPHQLRPPKPEKIQHKVIVIGASLGGPRALEFIIASLPKGLPAPIFIVQHLPSEFSQSFAKRLSAAKGPHVELAEEGLRPEKGVAYVAPGGKHLKLSWKGASSLLMRLDDGDPVNFVKPSVDVLFKSAADSLGESVLAIVLTGMGEDGTSGALAVKNCGGRVIVQDEATAVAPGMPKSVLDAGAADKVVPLEKIPEEIVKFLEE
ncbi:MAG: hypothetical protein A3K60_04710 [Euryarchaeota archaeon RBG_19FT_COMBO_56_21]|nr:MAG: hypothetical protein A3K60_04710 [Euryarchaeota archaeon RBG_19FT_COMBO_56_21]